MSTPNKTGQPFPAIPAATSIPPTLGLLTCDGVTPSIATHGTRPARTVGFFISHSGG